MRTTFRKLSRNAWRLDLKEMKPAKNSPVDRAVLIPPEPLLSAKNINEVRTMYPKLDDHHVALLFVHLRAFPDGMRYLKSLDLTDERLAIHVITARAVAIVQEVISQTPNERLPDNPDNSSAGGSV